MADTDLEIDEQFPIIVADLPFPMWGYEVQADKWKGAHTNNPAYFTRTDHTHLGARSAESLVLK